MRGQELPPHRVVLLLVGMLNTGFPNKLNFLVILASRCNVTSQSSHTRGRRVVRIVGCAVQTQSLCGLQGGATVLFLPIVESVVDRVERESNARVFGRPVVAGPQIVVESAVPLLNRNGSNGVSRQARRRNLLNDQ